MYKHAFSFVGKVPEVTCYVNFLQCFSTIFFPAKLLGTYFIIDLDTQLTTSVQVKFIF